MALSPVGGVTKGNLPHQKGDEPNKLPLLRQGSPLPRRQRLCLADQKEVEE